MRHVILAAAALSLGACTADELTERSAVTDGGSFLVTWWPVPEAIVVSDVWELGLTVHDGTNHGKLLTDVDAVAVDAAMPAHGHGMPVVPETTNGGDEWTAAPMQFQMPGDWEIAVVVTRDGTTETATFQVDCCEGATEDTDHEDTDGEHMEH